MAAIKQIFAKTDSLNGAQKRLGHYLQTDSAALLLSNVRDLAQAVGVSKSTVVRFAKSLGYKGFPEFRRDVQKEMRGKLRAASRMEQTFAELGNDEDIFTKLIKRDIELLQETLQAASFPDFHKAVEMIWRARKVFILGLNASMALAYLLYFRLVRVKKDVRWIFLTGGTSLLEQLAFMEEKDVLIAIEFLSVPREIQTALQHAKRVGAATLGITDFPNSAIAKAADVCLYAKRGLHTTVNSLTPAFSLVNALAIAVVWTKKADSIKALSDLDKQLEGYGP
ncbi:MAG TPA: MurR/RpiR family transcriptional regulator [Candidatus Binatia bacterium]|jgi:DNA-binding MurR/RpiR family transcriptional regulator|nr:MurR/RpiR family transcriptional regulator [Candidatus Binatia bacterium]